MKSFMMGKHDDDKDGSKKEPDPSKWKIPNDDGRRRHEKDDPDKSKTNN